MSDDSPLGNIREQLDASEGTDDDASDRDAAPAERPEGTASEGETADEERGPAFPFAESKQRPMYPHADRWEQLEDAKFEMETYLRAHGVKDVEGREIDDAILTYAIRNPEAVAELVLESRGRPDDPDG